MDFVFTTTALVTLVICQSALLIDIQKQKQNLETFKDEH